MESVSSPVGPNLTSPFYTPSVVYRWSLYPQLFDQIFPPHSIPLPWYIDGVHLPWRTRRDLPQTLDGSDKVTPRLELVGRKVLVSNDV